MPLNPCCRTRIAAHVNLLALEIARQGETTISSHYCHKNMYWCVAVTRYLTPVVGTVAEADKRPVPMPFTARDHSAPSSLRS